jgi:ABC-type Fe3+/spermidine/putrescine transport system ATPase subunit
MNGGDVIQVGSPLALYEHPATDFVASFLGDVNLVEGLAAEAAGGLVRVQIVDGLEVSTLGGPSLAPGKRVRLTIRPERFEIGTTGQAGPNAWRGRVREMVFHGELVRYGVEMQSSIAFKVTRPFRGPDTLFTPGQEVWLTSRPDDWRLFA